MNTDGKKAVILGKLENIFLQGIRFQRRGLLKKFWKLQAVGRHAIGASRKRKKFRKREGLPVPVAIAFSPTMRCNLSCAGCYARDYPRDGELPLNTIDDMLGSAEKMGVFLFIITGGEPLMRDGILDVLQKHKQLLFLMITNGTLLNDKVARTIARTGNIITVVSLEGSREQTDARRGHGMHDQVKHAMGYLQSENAVFGFSAMVTRENFETLSSNEFIEEMIGRGCALGFYTEYIPISSKVQWDWVLEDDERKLFRNKILALRSSKPIVLAHLPDDEYDSDGKCLAVANGCIHVNAQGYVEPCPFAHLASDNIREKGLNEIFRSQFLAQIRSSDAIFRHGKIGCALLENMGILQDIAANTGAKPTDCPEREPE